MRGVQNIGVLKISHFDFIVCSKNSGSRPGVSEKNQFLLFYTEGETGILKFGNLQVCGAVPRGWLLLLKKLKFLLDMV